MPDKRLRDSTEYSTHKPTIRARQRVRNMSPETRQKYNVRMREYGSIWNTCKRVSKREDYRRASIPVRRNMLLSNVNAVVDKRRETGRTMCGIDITEMVDRHLKKEADMRACQRGLKPMALSLKGISVDNADEDHDHHSHGAVGADEFAEWQRSSGADSPLPFDRDGTPHRPEPSIVDSRDVLARKVEELENQLYEQHMEQQQLYHLVRELHRRNDNQADIIDTIRRQITGQIRLGFDAPPFHADSSRPRPFESERLPFTRHFAAQEEPRMPWGHNMAPPPVDRPGHSQPHPMQPLFQREQFREPHADPYSHSGPIGGSFMPQQHETNSTGNSHVVPPLYSNDQAPAVGGQAQMPPMDARDRGNFPDYGGGFTQNWASQTPREPHQPNDQEPAHQSQALSQGPLIQEPLANPATNDNKLQQHQEQKQE